MSHEIVILCQRLADARARYDAFYDATTTPLEPGSSEFERAVALFSEIEEALDDLGGATVIDGEDACLVTQTMLHYATDVRPQVYRMIANLHAYLSRQG